MCTFSHSLTVEIRALLLDRPVSEVDLDRAYQINESLHQLTSCVNSAAGWSVADQVSLVRAIIDSSHLYGLEASVGRALATARNTVLNQIQRKTAEPELLEDIISLGGRALEVEDRELRVIAGQRGRHGGLLGTEYERHYQFIVWKSLAMRYDAEVEFSYGGYLVDLVILRDNIPTICEMKYWREESPTKVYSDILRLQSFPNGGYLLVFSANPKHLTEENIQIIGNLSGVTGPGHSYRFRTENRKGDDSYEFWFAGWPVPSASNQMIPSRRADSG